MSFTVCPDCGAASADEEWETIEGDEIAGLEEMGVDHADAVSLLVCPNCGARHDAGELFDSQ
jgi:ribosomal protein L32